MRFLYPAAFLFFAILAATGLADDQPASKVAALTEAAAEAEPGAGLKFIYWLIIAIYGSGTIGLGWYCSRNQKSTQEYFVGSGRMNPILVGV